MSYEKQTWASGDVITAEKLNHIESGIGASALVVKDTNGVLDKTWKEINDALLAGTMVICVYLEENDTTKSTIFDFVRRTTAYTDPENPEYAYAVEFEGYSFAADNENGYPEKV